MARAKDFTAEQLVRQGQAAQGLVAGLKADGHDDADLFHDMTEGATDLFEAIERALDEMDECDIIMAGIKEKVDELTTRKNRAERRKENLRGLIEQAVAIAELPSVKLPTATISLKAVPPKTLIEDEAKIPARFWNQPDPVLDKKALNEAVKNGETIDGVGKTNGGQSLQIRRS